MSSEMAVPVNPEKEAPTCRVCVSKDEASKMKVGSSVNLSLEGEVKSLHPDYNDKEMYEVEIANPSVEVENSDEEASEDDNMATMPREKLKEKIKKASSEY